jgi:hypothetical protein
VLDPLVAPVAGLVVVRDAAVAATDPPPPPPAALVIGAQSESAVKSSGETDSGQ